MPWSHCEAEVILDDEVCPTCGMTKPDWTVEVERTRTLRIGAAGKRRAAPTSWLEVLLQDVAGAPVAGAAIEVTLPTGVMRALTSGPDGLARLEAIPPGECRVTLPGRAHEGGRWRPGDGPGLDVPTDARYMAVLGEDRPRLVAAWWARRQPPPAEVTSVRAVAAPPAPAPTAPGRLISAAWAKGAT